MVKKEEKQMTKGWQRRKMNLKKTGRMMIRNL